jgi:putative transcriptional regulator
MIFNEMSDTAILNVIGTRVKQERLNQNRTQEILAEEARVGLNVIKNLESGEGCTLASLIRILRSLGKLDQLDMFLPEPGISPVQLAKFAGQQRREASGKRGRPIKRK